MRGVADTSWLYAFFVASDIHHSKAVQQSTKVETVHVPPAIVVETLDLIRLRNRLGRSKAENALSQMENDPHFRLADPPHDHAAAAQIYRAAKGLSYADAAAVAAARRLGLDLLTFDEGQQAAVATQSKS